MPLLALLLAPAPLPAGAAFVELTTFPAPEAHQAVAVDADHFYAIGNRVVAKYDKRTGGKLAEVRASEDLPLIHMNGGVVRDGVLIISHSNFPRVPQTGSVEYFSTAPLTHLTSLSLGPDSAGGSLTWVDRAGDRGLLAVFAHYDLPRLRGYDTGARRTELAFLGPDRLPKRYVLPESVVRRLRPHSVSGASAGPDDFLWLSGHDRPELYRVRFPNAGSEMVLDAVHPAPIAGQGVAWDPAEPGVLWGTRRGEGLVVKMRLTEAP